MSICRTCLSKKDLRPIFPDKYRTAKRATQLYSVTGVEIKPNDGLTQLICVPCINLVNGSLKLRAQSSNSDKILKNTNTDTVETDSQISKQEDDIFKTDSPISKQEDDTAKMDSPQKTISEQKDCKKENVKLPYSVKIEDFESSDESETNDIILEDLEFDSGDDKKVRIEDFESSDSFEEEDLVALREEAKRANKYYWEQREELRVKEFLAKERRKTETKKMETKLMSLAVTPYDPGGPICCTLCNKQVRNAQSFKSHAKTHFELQNACEECGKKFVARSHMRYHQQRVHGLKKRLACPMCPYRAVDLQQLQNHRRAEHTGERPYICDICGDSFRMRANIAQHMRKHFGVRNLQCEKCPAMFRSRSELTGHQNRVHNHTYTYFCYLCTETYRRPESVRKHLANIHGVPRTQQLRIRCVKTTKRDNNKSN